MSANEKYVKSAQKDPVLIRGLQKGKNSVNLKVVI